MFSSSGRGIEFSVFLSGFCVFIVTAVDSGSKTLESLGIHDEQGTSPSGSSENQVIGGGNLLRSWVINSRFLFGFGSSSQIQSQLI